MYESTITFTLDTICPWTYIARKRLEQALTNFASTEDAAKCSFTVRFASYQLHPAMTPEGEGKRDWYTRTKYDGDAERFGQFARAMDEVYARPLGFAFNWDGTMANTLEAHRVIQVVQGAEDFADAQQELGWVGPTRGGVKYGAETAGRLVDALYRMYFEEGAHPSSSESLLRACRDAGVEDADAQKLVLEDGDVGMPEVKAMVRMAGMNGTDSVPNVLFEGRRRDFTLIGAKEVTEYEKVLKSIVKESA